MDWQLLFDNYSAKVLYSKDIKEYTLAFKNKNVLEIGGPSLVFTSESLGLIPIYKSVSELSNVNYSYNTIWENTIAEGNTFKYGNRIGKQFVLEASDLHVITDDQYDGIISSHCLEHTANPIKVLMEWKRILKKDGKMLLLLPNKQFTFDHKRPYTSFEHLLSDYEQQTEENDLTHLEEILELHDVSMDRGLRGIDFKTRSLENFRNRCLHHHVFNDELVQQLASYTNFQLLKKNTFHKHLVYLLRKK